MTTESLMPVYPAEEVVKVIMKLRGIPSSVLKRFRTPPEPSARRIIAWHPGLSLREQLALPLVADRKLLRIRSDLGWYLDEFAKANVEDYRVCLPAPGTKGLTVERQEAAVAPFGEAACPVAIATWTWLVHFLATGESLGHGNWMRCADSIFRDCRVIVHPLPGQLEVSAYWDSAYSEHSQLASIKTAEGNLAS